MTKIKLSSKAPTVKHSLLEVVFMFAWLLRFIAGWQESCEVRSKYSSQISQKIASRTGNKNRFNEDYLTLKFIQESFDKISFDILSSGSSRCLTCRRSRASAPSTSGVSRHTRTTDTSWNSSPPWRSPAAK